MAVPIREVEPYEAGRCIYQVSEQRRRRREEPLKPPPGFHFKPTDSELAFGYLLKKLRSEPIPYDCIREVDVYEFHPQRIFEQNKKWEAEGKCYFFTTRTLKYPNGDRPARHTADGLGYWKATGSDKRLPEKGAEEAIWRQAETASKKTLVYYAGKAPRCTRTEWVMYEYVIDVNEEEKERRKNEREAKKAREKQQKLSNEQQGGGGGECMKMEGWALCTILKKRVSDAEGRGGDQADNPSRKKPRRENNNNSPAASEAGANANDHPIDEHNREANLQIVAQVDSVENEPCFPSYSDLIVSPSKETPLLDDGWAGANANDHPIDEHNGEANLQIVAQVDTLENEPCFPSYSDLIVSPLKETPFLDNGWDPNSSLSLESVCDEDSNALEQLYAMNAAPLPVPSQDSNALEQLYTMNATPLPVPSQDSNALEQSLDNDCSAIAIAIASAKPSNR